MKKEYILVIAIVSLIFIGIILTSYGLIEAWQNKKLIENQTTTTIKTTQPIMSIENWITIPSFDNLNEVVHPKVLYFEKKKNGFQYWMVSTPYSNVWNENPQITVSNDGINWIEPPKIKNPVSNYPSKKFNGSYHSDPFILYDSDHFELFYRKTKSYLNGEYKKNGYNYIYKQESTDGVKWTQKKILLNNDSKEQYMSISVIKENNIYKIWYFNYNGKIRYIEVNDFNNLPKPVNINIESFIGKPWHGEIQKFNNKYILIFMIKYKLYYTESVDGINFEKAKIINTELNELKDKKYTIYKSSYIISNEYIKLYITYRCDNKWKMYYIQKPLKDFYEDLID
ncbi:MAG TPA: hypothetical protein PKY25_02875 [Bacilli bacterium]|nr:hypothetical protein [Bacilli bacterium]